MLKTVFAAFVFVVAAHAQAADVYKIDTKASTVAWKGTKKVGDSHNGGISVKEGQVTVDKGQLTGGSVVVDMTTITNEDVKDAGYNKKLVGHLSTEDFFNAGKFPTSTFKITSVAPSKNKGEVLVKGDFTMIGGTHPIEFPAKVTVDKGVATGEAVVKIDRTKWGLKYGSGNFFKELAGDKIINDEFELTLKLVAKK
ncbi:YceI family protein [Bdellovibrio bacteriovorus]|uniref:YCE I like family protein n=1 Tax=Bdellovibrio bacteriovorus (strain ATCC 15356 / DSM 50701 / NCIMB 9529 / HD100) TaxID=264462 RepID=Q6MLK7_BDEBA|nr:YceI family protein [Bdellovibrio bacteriovorus]AHZ84495.1 YCE I like family protein [Bdellovibrio bacteriovorus]BEV68384.1 Protein YceI [Bdellovibrio bacteriovorus]CAE79850.1 YCE I like family protein [Bdellovibrio bacteriovorus HD100]